MFTSLGYHTFVISRNLTQEEADTLFNKFKEYRDKTKEICIIGHRIYDDKDPFGRHYDIFYPEQNKGIWWKIRFSNKGFIIDGEYKPCSIKATINPKILVGEKSYIVAANAGCLQEVKEIFESEVMKISPSLAGFHQYSLNRVDYCVNFDIAELKAKCPPQVKERLPEIVMSLIKYGDIPDHFTEEYGESENGDYTFYLKSKSIVINCYWKYADLEKNFKGCKDLKKSYDIIRFEVQFRYPKVHTEISAIRKEKENRRSLLEKRAMGLGLMDFQETQSAEKEIAKKELYEEYMNAGKDTIMEEMLSDRACNYWIKNYFRKVIGYGDYYTLDAAKKIIESKVPSQKKIARLTNTLQMIHDFGGISKTKKGFKSEEKLEEFRRSLRDLHVLRINPVTIPNEWNIEHIPNLLDNYFLLRDVENIRKQIKMRRGKMSCESGKKDKKRKK